jgi:hypothetical protein
MRAERYFVLLLLAIVASGCTTTRYVAQMPDLAADCVASVRDVSAIPLRYTAADAGDSAPVEFASIASCVRSAEGDPDAVALYRLDGVVTPAQVNVAVPLSTGGTFAAAVDVLDASFQPLQQYGFEKFVRRGSQYSLSVFLNPSGAVPAYLLLKPDPSYVGKSDTAVGSASNPVVIPAGPVIFTYHAGSETNAMRPFMQGGQVLVTAMPQSEATTSDQ